MLSRAKTVTLDEFHSFIYLFIYSLHSVPSIALEVRIKGAFFFFFCQAQHCGAIIQKHKQSSITVNKHSLTHSYILLDVIIIIFN